MSKYFDASSGISLISIGKMSNAFKDHEYFDFRTE